jgi:hypothetical protein
MCVCVHTYTMMHNPTWTQINCLLSSSFLHITLIIIVYTTDSVQFVVLIVLLLVEFLF